MCKPKTTEMFIKEINESCGNEFNILGAYKNAHTKIEVYHTTCNRKFMILPYKLLQRKKCSLCAVEKRKEANRKKDKNKLYKSFEEKLSKLHSNEYTIIGEYIDVKTKIKIVHKVCGRTIEKTPRTILQNTPCNCIDKPNNSKRRKYKLPEKAPESYRGKAHLLTHEVFTSRVSDILGDDYQVVSKYIDNKTHVKIYHKICGNVYSTLPSKVSMGRRCNICYGNKKRTDAEFKEIVFRVHSDEFEALGEYVNSYTKILFKHSKCGHVFTVNPNQVVQTGVTCPKCDASLGEQRIRKFLELHKIRYIAQYKFKDCKYKRQLPFDFAILDDAQKLQCLIEFDGEQHYRATKWFGGEENLQLTIVRDNIKNEYCKNKNIKLIRIPFFDYNNIEAILSKELSSEKSAILV